MSDSSNSMSAPCVWEGGRRLSLVCVCVLCDVYYRYLFSVFWYSVCFADLVAKTFSLCLLQKKFFSSNFLTCGNFFKLSVYPLRIAHPF